MQTIIIPLAGITTNARGRGEDYMLCDAPAGLKPVPEVFNPGPESRKPDDSWIPAFAGMTVLGFCDSLNCGGGAGRGKESDLSDVSSRVNAAKPHYALTPLARSE
jgi:hypothetical protein